MREGIARSWIVLFVLALAVVDVVSAGRKVEITGVRDDPMVAFAVVDITRALQRSGHEIVDRDGDLRIVFTLFEPGMGPQSFRIQKEGDRAIRIVYGDSLGAMYGGLELAEMISLGGGLEAVQEEARKPYLLRRGIKFNIPLDARAPSYDDTGSAAEENIAHMWDWDFWQDYLNTLARYRYNVLTLWTTHPYPGWVKLPAYPEIGYDDVCVLKKKMDMTSDRHFDELDVYDLGNFKVVKKISLDEKVAFWQRVFSLAEARGIEIYIFHWNIYTFGAKGRHGIDDRPDNQKTIDYMRYAIAQFLKTYPQVDGIGVTAGEHVDLQRVENVGGIERWLWQTYGQGVMDAKRANPDRQLRFIFRQHQANLGKIAAAFKDFDGPFNTGHKYARARLYSTTTSPYLDIEYRRHLEEYKVPCWLNLRNDDIFVFRWGDADYVREFLQNVPRDLMRYEAGFYMGPDGFVFGRDFVSKDPDLAGQLELHKHWYRYMLWGRLGYDPTLTRDHFEKRLAQRFPGENAGLIYDTWATASRIIPQVNRFFFRVNDFQFSPEACNYDEGFLPVDQFFEYPPLKGSGILSVQEYAAAIKADRDVDGMTPMDVATTLDRLAADTLAGVKALRASGGQSDEEFLATVADMEAIAYLGLYYADKIRGAAALAVFRADRKQKTYHERAVQYLTDAIKDWEAYGQVATRHYRPQLFSRTYYMDWERLLNDVKQEAQAVLDEGR